MPVQAKIELEGNFFRRDPKKTVRANIRDMLDALAGELGGEVRADIASHQSQMPNWTGWTHEHVHGITRWEGQRWQFWAAVQAVQEGMSANDAIRTQAAAASIERRWHPFRRGKGAVYRARALINADFTKGLD